MWLCKCDCGKESVVSRPNLVKFCTRSCGCLNIPSEDEYNFNRDRDFLKNVEKTDSCWIWKGGKDSKGYGLFSYRSRVMAAHRYSYSRNKERLRAGYLVCHSCDNPSCVNPDHLYLGTHKDNMKDVKERETWGGKRKLLEDIQKRACEYLFKGGFSLKEITKLLNISIQTAKRHSGKT